MRRLLSFASIFALILVAFSIAMYRRGSTATDWLRITFDDRSAVLASSGAHVGAAIISDSTGWTTRDDQRVRFKSFKPTDLREQFPSNVAGFAYRSESGAHLVLVPMWFVMLLGVTPPVLWLMLKRKRTPAPKPVTA